MQTSDRPQPSLKPLSEAVSLAERAYDAIRTAILRGELAMGERLVEERLAEQLGVSRAPVREALGVLADEMLVVHRPRSGMHVVTFDGEMMTELYNARLAVEMAAARLAARLGTPTDKLHQSTAEMRLFAQRNDLRGVVEAELTYHRELCKLARNRYLDNIAGRLQGQTRLALLFDDALTENLDDIADEHVPVTEAVESRNEDDAAAAIRRHIRFTASEAAKRHVDTTQML